MIVCKGLGITLRAITPRLALCVRAILYRRNACCKTADDCVCGYFRQMHFAKLRLGTRRNAFSLRTY